MDRFVNKKIEKQTIYEIYRACRLCGAGGGYKMPIIQNVVNIDGCDVELKQKIRECVQIEVHQDDRMPPLICELCVDKVNDFYEFLEMCRQTNKRTRLRLGLPPQMMPRGAPDADDCILGVTEPIYVNDEDSNEPLSDKRSKVTRRMLDSKIKKEPEKEKKDNKIKIGNTPPGRQCRSVRVRQPSPPSLRRDKREKESDNVSLSKLQHSKTKRASSPHPKSILKKGKDIKFQREESPVSPRLKRSREKETKPELPAKRVKISTKPPPPRPQPAARPPPPRPELKPTHPCNVCKQKFKAPQAVTSHMRSHTVTFTDPRCACNACGLWFPSVEEASAHHKRHTARGTPYSCRYCSSRYKLLQAFENHYSKCEKFEEVPDVECPRCWKTFPTENLMDKHRCPGEAGRKGGKCSKCSRSYATRKSLLRHEKGCARGEPIIDPEVQRSLKQLKVCVAKCDPLLTNKIGSHYDVSSVKTDFGLNKKCEYPYFSSGLRIKSEPSDCMVKINDLDFASYVHWDSDDDSGDSDADNMDLSLFTKPKKVESLTACALKVIFSKKFLGKVPRKFRRIKIENIINSALNDSLSELNINRDFDKSDECSANDSVIGDIKGSKNDSDVISDKKVSDKTVTDVKDDDLFPTENTNDKVTNDDFDSLFNNSDKLESNDKSVSLNDNLNGKINDNFNDTEDLVSGKSETVANHLTDLKDDSQETNTEEKINDNEANSLSRTGTEKGKDGISKQSVVDMISEENNGHNEKSISLESALNYIENGGNNEMNNDEQTESVIEDSTKKSGSETNEDGSQDSTDNKEISDTIDVDMKSINNQDETTKQDDENGKVEQSSVKQEQSDITTHSLNAEFIKENSREHSVVNSETSTEKEVSIKETVNSKSIQENSKDHREENSDTSTEKEVKDDNKEENNANDDSLLNGMSDEDTNLNMDDLEEWGDDLDDNKLMADLDEQIGEKTEKGDRTIAMGEKEMQDNNSGREKNTKDVNNLIESNDKDELSKTDKEKGESIDVKVLDHSKMDEDTDKITLDDLLQ